MPGLILKATDLSGIHSFEAIALRQSVRPIYMDKNSQIIKIKKNQFLKNKALLESVDEPGEQIAVEQIREFTTQGRGSDIMFLDGKRLKLHRTTIYTPLELE